MSMAEPKTAQEELIEVEQALSSIALGGQSYTIGSRKLTRADYSALLARKKELQAAIASEGNSSLFDNTFVSYFDRR
jgi:hypothetical protein